MIGVLVGVFVAGGARAEAQPTSQVWVLDETAIEGELLRPEMSLPEGSRTDARGHAAAGTPEALLERARARVERADRLRSQSYVQLDGAYEAARLSDRDTQERKERAHRELAEAARAEEQRALRDLGAAAQGSHGALGAPCGRGAPAEVGSGGPACNDIDGWPLPTRIAALSLRADVHEALGDRGAALDDARSVIALCPSCVEATRAHLRLAEAAFADGDMRAAIVGYDHALGVPSSARDAASRAYAFYKRAWARMNLGELDAAWDDFASARTEAARAGDDGERIAREAMRDRIRVLSLERVHPDEAVRRIGALGGDPRALDALADRYESMLRDEGRERDADLFARAWAGR